jgi:hypothetical protein
MVDPDCWLSALDGRRSPRRVKMDGRLQVDATSYSIKKELAGHRVMLRLNAVTRCFDVFRAEQFIKSVPGKRLARRADGSGRLHRSDARTRSFRRTPTPAPTSASALASRAKCVRSNGLPGLVLLATARLVEGRTHLFLRLIACFPRLLACFILAQSHLFSMEYASHRA